MTDRVERAQQAIALLRTPLLEEALATVEDDAVRRWKAANHVDDRESAHADMRAAQRVRRHLVGILEEAAHTERQRGVDGPFRHALKTIFGR